MPPRFACAALLAFGAVFAADEARLARGDIVTVFEPRPGSRYQWVVSDGVVRAPMARVFAVLTDFPRYPEFIPRMVSTQVLETKPREARYRGHIGMPWPIDDVFYECLAKLSPTGDALEFAMVPGTGVGVRHFAGAWTLSPFKGRADETLVRYKLDFEPQRHYPAWVMRLGSKNTIEKTIAALRERIRALENKAPR